MSLQELPGLPAGGLAPTHRVSLDWEGGGQAGGRALTQAPTLPGAHSLGTVAQLLSLERLCRVIQLL